MYKISWDQERNGVLLNDKIDDNQAIVPPRPVFHEELDLLGFGNHWTYPADTRPLLWAIGRTYYYQGRPVAEARGGNLYEKPQIVIHETLELQAINIEQVIERNREALSICADNAKDFVQSTYRTYQEKVDYFAVAFSGGKDSQVILDIVSQVLAPDQYIVVFTDTTMEIPYTYDTVAATQKAYQHIYPALQFYTARPPKDAAEFWQLAGSPSRLHRWCCSVCKTAPFVKTIRQLYQKDGKEGQPKILVFEGVRAEESVRRSKYKQITLNVKQMKQINAELILYWSVTEVFLYLFYRKIPINQGYRFGLHRVGCSICPFGSEWSESILREIAKEKTNQYVQILEKHAETTFHARRAIREYISTGQWKKRAGGRGISTNGTGLDFFQNNSNLKAILKGSKEDFFQWIKALGDVICESGQNYGSGEVKIGQESFSFEIEDVANQKKIIRINNIGKNILTQSKIKKALYKTTYCVHCGACEAECPVGALQVIPQVRIDTKQCIHCGKCLDFVEKGCVIAKSISTTEGGRTVQKNKIATSKYQTFGLRQEWLKDFLHHLDTWFEVNNLGNRQVESVVAWLKDAGLLDKNKIPTASAQILQKIIKTDENLAWEIIWTNLFYEIHLINWYVSYVDWNSVNSSKELVEKIVDFDECNKLKTTQNAISSLLNMFDHSPLGGQLRLGLLEKKGTTRYVKKLGADEIHPMAIAYSLYKVRDDKKRNDFTVSDFYVENCQGGPYKLFGISRRKFEDSLRYLQEEKDQIVRVDLSADLENIFLREDITPMDILQMVIN